MEIAVRKTLRAAILKAWPKAQVQRFEDKMAVGIPDNFAQIPGIGSWWLEGKFVILPKRYGTDVQVGLRASQRAWLLAHKAAGGRCGVFLKISDGRWGLISQAFPIGLVNGLTRDEFEALLDWESPERELDVKRMLMF